jgi:iron complex outermembrane receptor protein
MPAKESAKQFPSCLPFPHVGSGFKKKQRVASAARDNEQTMKSTLKLTVLACAIMQAFSVHAQQAVQPAQEVRITGHALRDHAQASVGGFSESPLVDTPASITSIDRTEMQDLSIRSVSDAVKYDASVADSYNAVGYAEQFSIRGFALDNNASYRKDGFAISADAPIPLENKERIEILKGLAGLQYGVASPGGVVNFVTKRPTNTPLRSVTVEARERGTVLGTIDLGGRFDDPRFGYRINAAAENTRSYVRGANGERQFVSGAFDWRISPDAKLELDFDHQHKAQVTAPGYQLIGKEMLLPTGVSPKTLLNAQPWTKPVDNESSNLGLRFTYNLGSDWRATVAANRHWLKRDDYTAFPYGCTSEGLFPGYCSNGNYDVYDYQSVGERKYLLGAQAMLQGRFKTGALDHALTLGASRSELSEHFGDYVYDPVGTSNIYHNVIVPQSSLTTGQVFERRNRSENALFVQDIVTLSPQVKLHAGLRRVEAKRFENVNPEIGPVHSAGTYLLPSVALVYSAAPGWNVYGSYSHGLEHGGVAPLETTNKGSALDANRSKQIELGLKGAVNSSLAVSAALFQIRRGLEYSKPVANTDPVTYTFVGNGQRTHRGLELSASGKASKDLDYGLSLMALHTRQQGPSIDGKRVANVPAFQSTAWVEYALPAVPAMTVSAVWQHAGKKAFDVQNRTMVPGYDVLGLGAAYALNVGATKVTLRARADNVFNKFYWRDVSPELGGYLLPGAPRTFRLSAQLDF